MRSQEAKERIGKEYIEADSLPYENSDRVRRAYRRIARINEHLYSQIPIEVIWQKEDPYDSYADMRETVAKEGVLRVFSGGSGTRYLSHEENVKGRAVHDFFGHLEADVDFSFCGEFRKWLHVKDRYPPDAQSVLFTEVVGQRAAAGYLDEGFASDRFEQRAAFPKAGWIDIAWSACKR